MLGSLLGAVVDGRAMVAVFAVFAVVASVVAPEGSFPGGLSLTGRWLGFTSTNGPSEGGQWLLDVRRKALYRLPLAEGLQQVRLRGDHVTWRENGRTGPRGPHVTVLGRLAP